MRVVIIRHAEVDFCWSRRCTSDMFDSECRKYDCSPIKNVPYSIPQTVYQKMFVEAQKNGLLGFGQAIILINQKLEK